MTNIQPNRALVEETFAKEGYAAAKALADKMGIIWFASAGKVRAR